MKTPEGTMKRGFASLKKARRYFERSVVMYKLRNNDQKADRYNAINTHAAIILLDQAYDEISAIWENDINV
jgi:hypothetical protein